MKKLLVISIPVFFFAMTFIWMAAQGNRHRQVVDPKPLKDLIIMHHESGTTMIVLAALDKPMQDRESLVNVVCIGMNAGGCDYFEINQADGIYRHEKASAILDS